MKTPKSLQNIDLQAAIRRSGIYGKLKENQDLKQAFKPYAKKVVNKDIKDAYSRSTHFSDGVIDAYWQKQIRVVEVIEAKFQTKLEQFIDSIGQAFLKNLDQEVSNRKQFAAFLKKDFFDDNEGDFLTKAELDFTPLLDNLATIAGNEANKLIGVKTPYLTLDYRKKIIHNVNKFTKSMLDTDRDHLIGLITNAIQDGQSLVEIRNAIEADFTQYSKNQADRITRTEVIRVSNQATLDAFKQSDVVVGKQWVTFGAVDECADYEGQVESLDSNFYGATDEFADGDPPLHPNCRCILIPVLSDE